jgi:hypothetical protein
MTTPTPVNAGFTRPPSWAVIQGLNGAGACILSRVNKGDLIVGVYDLATRASAAASFETTTSVQGQTSASNLSGHQYWVATFPQS